MKLKNIIEYHTTKEMAEKWNISAKKVTKYCRDEKLPKAYKDNKSKKWMIPSDSIKPLTKKEEKTSLVLILKVMNSLKIDEIETMKYIDAQENIQSVFVYLSHYGYIRYVGEVKSIKTLVFTDKAFNELGTGIVINIKVGSILQIVAALAAIGKAIGA
ncbi:MAG: helix-turn-helix domain-containing protein [Bacilli bacterium]|nr:helix-turn-helix domain-containing protein [Bacilli bacterium]